MSTSNHRPDRHKEHRKANRLASQKQTIFRFLRKNVATASMIAHDTGIPKERITRIKADLQKEGKLWEVFKGRCQRTGYKAWYLTTSIEKTDRRPAQANLPFSAISKTQKRRRHGI